MKISHSEVITFASPKPEVIYLKTIGNATYGDCAKKLNMESKRFIDKDSKYVIKRLKRHCILNANFRNNLMRKEKTYGGALQYIYKAAQNGYCIKYGNIGFISRDIALELAIDYFNHDEAEGFRRNAKREV